jgi:hypothetical protein
MRESQMRNNAEEKSGLARCCSTELAACTTAISIEFVAKPNFAQRVRTLVPPAVNKTFAALESFSGCALMVSDQEERLITLLAFWSGRLDSTVAAHNTRWLCKLIEPYLDRKLRVQTLRSHLAILPEEAMPAAPTAEPYFAARRAQVA